jgi:hypothetical protein
MVREFIAAEVFAGEVPELGIEAAIFSSPSGARLEIQCSREDSEQDRRPGLYGSCLVDELGRTVYRCVAGWRLKGQMLEVDLNESGQHVFGFAGFLIHLPTGTSSSLGDVLFRILGEPPTW